MSNLTIPTITLAVSSGCLATYFTSENPLLYSYARSSLLSFLGLFLARKFYEKFIYPFYTSLVGLPQLPRPLGWKHAFTVISPDDVLDAMDTVPNDGLIRHVDTFNRELILVTSPSGVAEFLQTHADDCTKAPAITKLLIDMLGNGIVTAEGPQRKLLASEQSKELYPLFWSKASQMVSLIQDEIKANEASYTAARINMEDWIGCIALDIIGEAGFGLNFDSLIHPFNTLNNSYRAAFVVDESSRLFYVLSVLTTPALSNLLPLKQVWDKLAGLKEVTKWVKSMIEARKRDMYLNFDDLNYFEKMGHKDIISTVMKAGTKPAFATGLTWAIHILSQPENLHIQQRLREEIRSKLPSPESGVAVNAEMLDTLPYLDAVSKEMLRVYPPLPVSGRLAIRDTRLCGQRIPKGTYVRVAPCGLNKSKKYWGEDAREFKPERWLVGENKATSGCVDSLATITFGHGPRGCIGKSFAQAENKAVLAALIGRFEIKQVGGKHVKPKISFALTAKVVGLQVETTVLDGW